MENSGSIFNRRQKRSKPRESYFTDTMDRTEYLSLENINKKKLDTTEVDICFTDSNSKFVKGKNNVPLRVLIRQMLDEAFGKSNGTVDVSKDRLNFKDKDCKVDSSLISVKEESMALHNEMNDRSLLHESFSDSTKRKDDRLITIEEETTHFDSIECTGIYLSGLLKFDDKPVVQSENDHPLLSRNGSEISISEVDTDIPVNDSLRCNFVNDESSICHKNNDNKKKSIMIINTINSFNNDFEVVSLDSSDEKTADFLNISKKGNSVETMQMAHKSLSLSEKDNTKFSIDASSVDLDSSLKSRPIFISTLTLNLRRSYKKHRQSITLFRQTWLKRTPKLSLNTSSQLAKTTIYSCNTALSQKQVNCRNISSVKIANTPKPTKTPKTLKVYPNRAKPLRSRGIPKQRQAFIPQIILTPATPKKIC